LVARAPTSPAGSVLLDDGQVLGLGLHGGAVLIVLLAEAAPTPHTVSLVLLQQIDTPHLVLVVPTSPVRRNQWGLGGARHQPAGGRRHQHAWPAPA
jgi:hypothetical protein